MAKRKQSEEELAKKYRQYMDGHRERQRKYREQQKAAGKVRVSKYVSQKRKEAIKEIIDIVENEDLSRFCIARPNPENLENPKNWKPIKSFNIENEPPNPFD